MIPWPGFHLTMSKTINPTLRIIEKLEDGIDHFQNIMLVKIYVEDHILSATMKDDINIFRLININIFYVKSNTFSNINF